MGLNILSVAYPLTPVGPNAVGGSEQILTILDRALTKEGHNSYVVAVEGSEVTGRLIPTPSANGALTDTVRRWGQQQHRIAIEQALKRYSIDLVHMHSLDFHRYLPKAKVPVLATLHLPPSWYPRDMFRSTRPNTYMQCVSAAQRRSCPRSPLLVTTIPNGIDVQRFDSKIAKRNFALSLGRICPEKGYHYALEAAKKARVEFLLAGEIFPYAAHQTYFKQEILPRLSKRRRFIGPAGFARKRRLLNEARCLLIPSTVAETSSLVAMEALASGTPVIAFPSGALADIVDHGRTGYLVNDEYEMAEAIKASRELKPEVCRAVAREQFSSERMVKRYLETYNYIVDRGAGTPACRVGTHADTSFAQSRISPG